MVLDPIPQSLPVHFFGSRPQPPTSLKSPTKHRIDRYCENKVRDIYLHRTSNIYLNTTSNICLHQSSWCVFPNIELIDVEKTKFVICIYRSSVHVALPVEQVSCEGVTIRRQMCIYSYIHAYTYACIHIKSAFCIDSRAGLVLAVVYTTTHCFTLQHTATHCNTLQHTATHCNTLAVVYSLFEDLSESTRRTVAR